MILDKYILKNHFVPFVYASLSLMGIFLLQFLMKFADRLVGKGLGLWVIIKLIVYNLAWMVVLVIPMATLVATLMAYGNMSQNDEITIIKSSGVSLYRMLAAPILASVVLAYLLFLFNDDVLPDANHKAKVLMQDISRQKPTLSLTPGVFSQEVTNYSILARDVKPKTNLLYNLTIYNYSNPTKIDIVTAREGKLFFSKDQTKLIMDLKNGEIHQSDITDKNLYRKILFDKHRIIMSADKFSFQQSAPGGPRGDRELSTTAMSVIIDSLELIKQNTVSILDKQVEKYFFINPSTVKTKHQNRNNKKAVYLNALNNVTTTKNILLSGYNRITFLQDRINSYWVEIYKKYALPFACIVFVIIGAPLGVKVKKGGFGVAASISLFFFLIYWAFLIGGEKLGNRNMLPPFWGMWAANILLSFIGIILIIKTVKETKVIQLTFLKKIIPKKLKFLSPKSE
ncbi:MAG: YjgP/YjgQ family permease [Ignavibacteriales bacterium CG12_big_fil_rev_8_21_14_0_65_30_8]|nr:MAG: YjgP/YjgQ family permease [Ignavibacteriales bacterium CG12_big_fil_rev_8_21_14_0_65_30_8]